MATKKKYYYYVLVFTNEGPVYVTGIETEGKWAHWNKSETPKEFSEIYATELALGLAVNGHSVVSIKSLYQIDSQPYNYADYKVEWKKIEKTEEE